MASHRGPRPTLFGRLTALLSAVALLLATTVPVLASASPVQVRADETWLPEPTKTVDSASELPITLANGDVLLIKDVTYSAETGVSPIALADGATATVIVEGTVELHGADAEGRTGATPAIEVPETATLIVYGAHDEELAGTDEAPKDSLIVTGGDPAVGENGQNGKGTAYETAGTDDVVELKVRSGDGGDGGGGGAAAIGGRGGDGGAGGTGVTGAMDKNGVLHDDWTVVWANGEMRSNEGSANDLFIGVSGKAGEAGEQGGVCGAVYLLGRMNLSATTTGENAVGGNGGAGDGGGNDGGRLWQATWEVYGGPGGGGGGGGSGATGTSDDGSGAISDTYPYDCPGGSGGGGGWPNGGGGGGGGHQGSNGFEEDGKSQGGGGGAGGKDSGASGGRGYVYSKDYSWSDQWFVHIEGYSGWYGFGAGGVDAAAGGGGSRWLHRYRHRRLC